MKKPKTKVPINITKTPQIFEEPIKYKDLPIAWQVSGIDNGSKWGYSALKDQVTLSAEKIIDELKGCHNDLTETLIKLNGQKFKTIDDMLERIHHDSNGNITSEEQRVILRAVGENIFWTQIFGKLEHFENNPWKEIEKEQYGKEGKTKHHPVEVWKIIKEAQKRLEALKLDDYEEIYSIRITGKIRLWGIRNFSHLKIIWIDLEHEICPS